MDQKLIALFAIALVGTLGAGFFLYQAGSPNPNMFASVNQETAMWEQWKLQYNKDYEPMEDSYRFKVFQQNYEIVLNTNAENLGYTLGLNKFADLTSEEFKTQYCGYTPSETEEEVEYAWIDYNVELPSSVNWTAAGATTPVKNQGSCGSCWSFSATGALEGLNFITNGNLQSYSEQQLMDCSRKYGNKACQGGLMDYAFAYVAKEGIELETSYPYRGRDDLICRYKAADVAFRISGFTDVTPNNVEALMAAVAQQPVSVAVEADQSSWQLYTGGIVSSNCGQALDHGVLAVGYGTQSGTAFWNVKNSWGADWGQNGYILIQRSSADLCGILLDPSYPTV